jgi:phosphate:Na+ symporter
MILGAQVGTCITAIIASARGSLSGKRAALAHLIFNLVSVVIASVMVPVYVRLVPLVADTMPVQIGVVHVAVRVVGVLLFLPITRVLAKAVIFIAKGTDKLNATPAHLSFSGIHEPEIALRSAELEIQALFETSMGVWNDSIEAFISGDEKAGRLVRRREGLIDDLSLTISEYLIRVAKELIPERLVHMPPLLVHVLGDVERLGDHAENIVELLRVQSNAGVHFSPKAVDELRALQRLIDTLADHVRSTMVDRDDAQLRAVLQTKGKINEAVDRALDHHATRLGDGVCHPVGGMVFADIVTNMRRVANHLRNIAASIGSRAPEPVMQIHTLKEAMRTEEEGSE